MAQEPRLGWPLLVCRAGPEGLTLEASAGGLAVRHHRPGERPPACLAFRAPLLAEVEGRTGAPVTLRGAAPGRGRAAWDDGGVPGSRAFDAVPPDSVPPFPEPPGE